MTDNHCYSIDYLKYKGFVSSLETINENLFASGDRKGKIYIWDVRESKAVQYINTNNPQRIK